MGYPGLHRTSLASSVRWCAHSQRRTHSNSSARWRAHNLHSIYLNSSVRWRALSLVFCPLARYRFERSERYESQIQSPCKTSTSRQTRIKPNSAIQSTRPACKSMTSGSLLLSKQRSPPGGQCQCPSYKRSYPRRRSYPRKPSHLFPPKRRSSQPK